jgi:hypothetical protein
VLQLLQWGLAGFKGSSEIEGVLDKAIEASHEAAKNSEGTPAPAMVAAQMAQQLETTKGQNAMGLIQAKAEATSRARQEDMQADIATAHENHIRKIAEIDAGLNAKVGEIQASLQADLLMEQAQAASNIQQTQATVEGEIQKDMFEAELNIATETEKTTQEITKIVTAASMDIKKSQAAALSKPEAKSE